MLFALGILGCESRHADSPADALASRQAGLCVPSEPVNLFLSGGASSAGTIDIECDGILDSVVVDRVIVGGVATTQLRVGDRAPYLFRTLDGVPSLVEAVDIDRDGVRDLLLALIDESTVLPILVRVTRSELQGYDESDLDWRRLQYLWFEGDDLDACAMTVIPRSELLLSGERYVRVHTSLGDSACSLSTSIALVVRSDKLQIDSIETKRLRTAR